jgi:hypothetical protein
VEVGSEILLDETFVLLLVLFIDNGGQFLLEIDLVLFWLRIRSRLHFILPIVLFELIEITVQILLGLKITG